MIFPEVIDDDWIVAKRGRKNKVDSYKPYAWLIEKEFSERGTTEDTAIIFLTNRECPFHCLMCDLWKNTTDETVPAGSIVTQIESVIDKFAGVKYIKLYNSGSFFDPRAIPPSEHKQIAALLKDFETVIVESHPAFINERVLEFRDMLKPKLEIAIGLETVHPEILSRLNKHMDLGKFTDAVQFLYINDIRIRAFILLKTPFMNENEGIFWAGKSIDFAFNAGVDCCTIIPVRSGNGAMDYLKEKGFFSLPSISSIEKVLQYGIGLGRGRVFADTWDLGLFESDHECIDETIKRIVNMNLTQKFPA